MFVLFLVVGLVMTLVLAASVAVGIVMILREASRDAVSRVERYAYLRPRAAPAFGDEITPAAAPADTAKCNNLVSPSSGCQQGVPADESLAEGAEHPAG